MNNMKGLGSALPNRKGGKGKPAAEEEEEDDDEFDPSTLSALISSGLLVKGGLTSNPELIKALQGRLDGLVGRNSGYIDSLPSKARAPFAALEGTRLAAAGPFRRQRACAAQGALAALLRSASRGGVVA